MMYVRKYPEEKAVKAYNVAAPIQAALPVVVPLFVKGRRMGRNGTGLDWCIFWMEAA